MGVQLPAGPKDRASRPGTVRGRPDGVGVTKRAAVSAEAGQKTTKTAIKVIEKTAAQQEQISAAIERVSAFSALSTEAKKQVVDAMFEKICKKEENVIVQGDMGDFFYVVASGEYAVLLKQKGRTPVHFYKAGDSFGELALMYNTPRAATVQCIAGGSLWAIDRELFRNVLVSNSQQQAENTSQFLKSVSFLSTLTDQQREAVGSVLIEELYQVGDVIVQQGERADSLYVIKKGGCSAYLSDDNMKTRGKEVAKMREGGIFGESALSNEFALRQATVVATAPDTAMFMLKKRDFNDLLGDLGDLVKQNFNQKVLGSMEMFKVLSKTQQAMLVDSLEEERYKKDATIIKQDDLGTAFYIVVSGSVRVVRVDPETGRSSLIKDKLSAGAYFGEMALMQDAPRMANVIANEDAVVMSLEKSVFNEMIGDLNDLMTREAERRKREVERKLRPPMKLDDLEVMRTLGTGTFGRVKMVRHKPTDCAYALKCMRKGQMIAMKQVDHVMNEKVIMEMCDHPFLLAAVATFQDATQLYMVFDLILGGELFTVLREKKKFSLETSRFYCACVAAAFTYLHERKIVYRDLKPENLLFDADGYAKVVDFGFAKIVSEKTFTLCGTPDYLAPEIIQNKGHNASADWWSFGVLVYECLVGNAPFEADDPMDIYSNILTEEVKYPYFFNGTARHLIDNLLDRNPISRLGSLGLGSLDILEHDFFDDLSFAELEMKTIPAPHVPDIRDPFDASNFDDDMDDGDDDDDSDDEDAQQRKAWEEYNTDPSLFNKF